MTSNHHNPSATSIITTDETAASHAIHLALHPLRVIKRGPRRAPRRCELSTPFQWPLGPHGDLAPRILAAHEGDRPAVDLGYARIAPAVVPVLAANDGEVSCALESCGGYAISLDHGGTWCTHYTCLNKLGVTRCLPRLERRQSVRAGDVIGYTTGKLGFELWQWTEDRGFVAVDPSPHLATWADAPVATATTSKEAA